MASQKEIKKLVTDINLTAGSGRPSRNSQVICKTSIQPTIPTTPLLETPINTATDLHTPATTPTARGTPSKGNSSAGPYQPAHKTDRYKYSHLALDSMICDPQDRPLQPGMVIFL